MSYTAIVLNPTGQHLATLTLDSDTIHDHLRWVEQPPELDARRYPTLARIAEHQRIRPRQITAPLDPLETEHARLLADRLDVAVYRLDPTAAPGA